MCQTIGKLKLSDMCEDGMEGTDREDEEKKELARERGGGEYPLKDDT